MPETPVLENPIQEETFPNHEKAVIRIRFLREAQLMLIRVSGVAKIEYKVLREEEISGAVPPIIVKTTKPQLLPKTISIGGITTTIECE